MKRCEYQLIQWSVLILPCNQQLYLFCVKNRKNRLACRWRNTVIFKDECKKPDRVINKHIWLFISYILAKKMFNHHIKIPSNSIIFSLASLGWFSNRRNVSWWRRAQIKQLTWPIAEQQIGQQKLSLVFSTHFPVVKWCSQSVAESAYYKNCTYMHN